MRHSVPSRSPYAAQAGPFERDRFATGVAVVKVKPVMQGMAMKVPIAFGPTLTWTSLAQKH